ncbi:MAG: hypothetical protein K8T90_09835 [Planctomycetes bacterium]|nr:hypothetical protein [Planctomycetota bacterium]
MTQPAREAPGHGPGSSADALRLKQYRALLIVRALLGASAPLPLIGFTGPALAIGCALALSAGPALASLRCRAAAVRLREDRTAASSDVSTAGFLVFSVACAYGLGGAACIAYGLFVSDKTTASVGAALLLCTPMDYGIMRRSFRVVADEV